jgi:hypothetical protein
LTPGIPKHWIHRTPIFSCRDCNDWKDMKDDLAPPLPDCLYLPWPGT